MKERELIEQIQRLVGTDSGELLQGIGDDCAVISKTADTAWLLTMDTLLEGVHFELDLHPPEQLAEKSVAVNVSDIAAMGGKPLFVLLSLGLPRGFDETWFGRFSSGLARALEDYGCLLIGGDTVASPGPVALTLTVVGEAQVSNILYRSKAGIGDSIWVSGPLGLSAAGFELLHMERVMPELQPLIDAHLRPCARVDLGIKLAESGLVHAMMDVSDGLATDLAHLARASGVGARIFADHLVPHPVLNQAAKMLEKDPLQWMLQGGEDYELLFTAAPKNSAQLTQLAASSGLYLSQVGTVVSGSGVTLVTGGCNGAELHEIPVSYQGFDHFRDDAGSSRKIDSKVKAVR
jgi:thiamine-monophosphate kinase